MKTSPMNHQLVGLDRMDRRRAYALFCEQGTGKTWMLLADAERLFERGLIAQVLVIAPRGVHTNWVRREIPAHLSVEHEALAYIPNARMWWTKKFKALLAPRRERALRVFSMNIDAAVTKRGNALAKAFLANGDTMLVVDESQRIKNPSAVRTKRVLELGSLAKVRRIASGTPLTNAPPDLFAQFEFLRSGILGTTSYRAFVSEYAQLIPSNDRRMVAIRRKIRSGVPEPQIVDRDSEGRRLWRNLDKLNALIEPHCYRVTRAECLDLPEKIYQTHYFSLSADQRARYELLQHRLRFELEGETLSFQRIAAVTKLQQVTSGFIMVEGEPREFAEEPNPRLEAFIDAIEDIELPCIVWTKFHAEMDALAAALHKLDFSVVRYDGRTNAADREAAVDRFQNGDAQFFLGEPSSGGVGLTLTAARTVIYYSNSYNMEHRAQSEDRAHRIGTKTNVVYIDLVAEDTIDEQITRALQDKADVAATVLGDPLQPKNAQKR